MILTLIVPCYNEQESLRIFYDEVCRVALLMPEAEFDILFVNDGSQDNTMQEIKALAAENSRVRYISFSRNFGKEAAIYAGLLHSRGAYTAIMDADLQDPPALLPEMFQAVANDGYDSAATRRATRKGEPPIRSFFAEMFYKLMKQVSKTEVVSGARDFRLMNRKYVDALLSLSEYNRFSKGLFGWVGFKTKWIEFDNVERVAGNTKWSFWSLFRYSIDGIVAFSTVPLVLSSVMGVICCLIVVVSALFVIIRKLTYGHSAYGWASMITVILFLGGLQMLFIGILGQYLSKTYLETKKRPIFIIDESSS